MQRPRELAVGFVDVFLGGGVRDAQEGVESGIGAFVREDFIAEAEDFVVFLGPSGGESGEREDKEQQ